MGQENKVQDRTVVSAQVALEMNKRIEDFAAALNVPKQSVIIWALSVYFDGATNVPRPEPQVTQ